MDRNLGLEMVRVTEAAALASARWLGKGDKNAADQAAVKAMRSVFSDVEFDGTVVIGEGERDEAPMLYIGEKVGTGRPPQVDIALDPLECTNSVAFARPNALAVVAVGRHGHFLHAPDTYMEKIAVGEKARDAIDLNLTPAENLQHIADALGIPLENLTVVILDRDRHEPLIRQVRTAGCRIQLIPDGDVSAAIATALPDTGVDVLMGIGGAPEGVLAAAALRCVGGAMQARLRLRNQQEAERARAMGVTDLDRIYTESDLARGDTIMFAATGVTNGDLLRGVQFAHEGAVTHSIVMRSNTRTIRFIETHHSFINHPAFEGS
ncbi:MAG: class II fructose-bisphosphatase [candidate division Zixibacteria bacterium]|nr:class II fructose-bisphosphatase [candidate division Zixibacteria bacterium]